MLTNDILIKYHDFKIDFLDHGVSSVESVVLSLVTQIPENENNCRNLSLCIYKLGNLTLYS